MSFLIKIGQFPLKIRYSFARIPVRTRKRSRNHFVVVYTTATVDRARFMAGTNRARARAFLSPSFREHGRSRSRFVFSVFTRARIWRKPRPVCWRNDDQFVVVAKRTPGDQSSSCYRSNRRREIATRLLYVVICFFTE